MEDVRRLLKRFGTGLYGDRMGDLEMMEEELEEMHRLGMIDRNYLSARRVIMGRREIEDNGHRMVYLFVKFCSRFVV